MNATVKIKNRKGCQTLGAPPDQHPVIFAGKQQQWSGESKRRERLGHLRFGCPFEKIRGGARWHGEKEDGDERDGVEGDGVERGSGGAVSVIFRGLAPRDVKLDVVALGQSLGAVQDAIPSKDTSAKNQ